MGSEHVSMLALEQRAAFKGLHDLSQAPDEVMWPVMLDPC